MPKETNKETTTKYGVGDIVRQMEGNWVSGVTNQSKYVSYNISEKLNKIDAYSASKHTTGDTDSQGAEKPFFDITTASVNIWYRATDIDRKNIKIRAGKRKDVTNATIATIKLQDWMKRERFGVFLNDWGRTLAKYGSAITKFVEQDKKLHCIVVPWQRIICDSIDFENNIKIEILELTEAQLRARKGYDKNVVDSLCEALSVRRTTDKIDKDTNNNNYVRLYEVHGLLPLSYITGKEQDEYEFVQQMHVISYVASNEKGKYDDYVLVKGREESDPYMLTHLIKEEGQTLSIGAVEHLFEAQWMLNHSVKAIKDQLDLASKLIFQTSDQSFVGQNALTAIQNGDILIHAVNQPLTQVNNNSHDITSWQSFGNQWKALSNEINGISESMLGNTPPAGTAWRQVEALLQESHSLFELMTENKALAIEDMLRMKILPFIRKNLNDRNEISGILDNNDIQKIDSRYIKNVAIRMTNKAIKDKWLSGGEPTPEEQAQILQSSAMELSNGLKETGNQRFIEPSEVSWAEALKDLEWDVEVDITGENYDTQTAMATINSFLTFLARKNGQPITEEERFWLNKIMTMTGIVSPLETSALPSGNKPIGNPVNVPTNITAGLNTPPVVNPVGA